MLRVDGGTSLGNGCIVVISLFMGGESTPSRAVVQSAGGAYRLPTRRGNKGGVQPGARFAPALALHAGADHADGANGRCATATIRLTSSFAAGSSSAWIASRATSW